MFLNWVYLIYQWEQLHLIYSTIGTQHLHFFQAPQMSMTIFILVVYYFVDGVVFWRGWCGTLKWVVWYFVEQLHQIYTIIEMIQHLNRFQATQMSMTIFMLVVYYFEEDVVLLWRGWCSTLRMMVWYFEEGCVVLWRRWCGTSKRVVWYCEDGGVVLERGLCGTVKMVVWYFDGWCGTLKRVVLYFEEGCVVLWRWWCDPLKKVVWSQFL